MKIFRKIKKFFEYKKRAIMIRGKTKKRMVQLFDLNK